MSHLKDVLRTTISKFDVIATITAFTVMTVFGYSSYYVLRYAVPDPNREIVIHTMGMIEGAVIMVVSYYFGSSKRQGSESIQKETTTQEQKPVE